MTLKKENTQRFPAFAEAFDSANTEINQTLSAIMETLGNLVDTTTVTMMMPAIINSTQAFTSRVPPQHRAAMATPASQYERLVDKNRIHTATKTAKKEMVSDSLSAVKFHLTIMGIKLNNKGNANRKMRPVLVRADLAHANARNENAARLNTI